MSDWVINRLIGLCLDNSAVFEAAAVVPGSDSQGERLQALAGASTASAQDLARLSRRLGGTPLLAGTAHGAARCRTLLRLGQLGAVTTPGALGTALRSVKSALTTCEILRALALPPLVMAAVEAIHLDLRMDRLALMRLLDETRGGACPEPPNLPPGGAGR